MNLRIPEFLDGRNMTVAMLSPSAYDGGNVVTPMVPGVTKLTPSYAECLETLGVSNSWRRSYLPRYTPGIHFCQRLSRNQGHISAGTIKSNSDLLVNFKDT
jgi:hypothetical protein